MFSSALKSITSSNINSNYTISPTPTSSAGPWKIHDAKKKSTNKPHSVFIFDKKSLEAQTHASSIGGRSGGVGGSSSSSSFKRSVEEVVERLKKEASSLAKLRHPSILELVEPVEETRGGGLQFVTEAVTASLAGLLLEKDEQERRGGSRYVTTEDHGDGGGGGGGRRRRREVEIDELEIQKGLLQISKALDFLHENAGLVHGNLTPDAVLVNAKSDWKISGLAFCSPAEGSGSAKPSSIQPISLAEALNIDPRLPRSVQLDLAFTSPDLVIDANLTPAADMFSLGLLSVALYNSPHHSPLQSYLESHGSSSSSSTYKRAFSSPAGIPTSSNNFLSSRPLPKDLAQHVLPRLITRRPAQRMTAREFQASEYFDNILVSTIRFLDSFPAKTPQEKTQFLRGLVKVLPSFPKSVMEKKLLPALLDEMKDRPLLALILQNVFKIVSLLPSARRAFGDKIRPALKAVFVENAKQQNQEKDPARDAGLMVFLEQISVIAENCNGKEFKEDILPVVLAAIECPTPSIVDVALRSLPLVLPVLDFSTIKNELFPIVCTVFSKTSSLAIKVRGLEAFVVLCGGSLTPSSNSASIPDDSGLDGLSGLSVTESSTKKSAPSSSSSALDKYTMQEKIVPLIKAIKTKEPAVMMAARDLLLIIGQTADAEFVAMDILPILWTMSLGPLLNLKQFQAFMALVRTLSKRVEDEQTRKLHELAGTAGGATAAAASDDFLAFGGVSGTAFDHVTGSGEDDFEALVKGRATSPGSISITSSVRNGNGNGSAIAGWVDTTAKASTPKSLLGAAAAPSPSFSWSTPPPQAAQAVTATVSKTRPGLRTSPETATRFEALTPSATQFSQPLQPATLPPASPPSIKWPSAASQASSPPAAAPQYSSFNASSTTSFSLAPPPSSTASASASASVTATALNNTGFSLAPPPSAPRQTGWTSPVSLGSLGASNSSLGNMATSMSMNNKTSLGTSMSMAQGQGQAKSGLDKYESLI